MNATDKYLIIGLGCIFAIVGIILFSKKSGKGQNKIKIMNIEIELSAPSLVVFVIGALMIIFPFFITSKVTLQPDFSAHAATIPSTTSTSNVNPQYIVDAAMDFSRIKETLYLMRGNDYWRYSTKGSVSTTGNLYKDSGYPRKISLTTWPDLPFESIDAVVKWSDYKSYIFKGNQFVRYDDRADKAISAPIQITQETFPGLSFSNIDAAFNLDGDQVYFFSGDEYAIFSISDNRIKRNFPRKINHQNFPGLPFTTIDAAVPLSQFKVLLFSLDRYVIYDIQSPKTHYQVLETAALLN
ncbi:MAG: hemopexin repeat-containing protein [Gammaproteobacteria bacterium]|nr:hemopexin repeat-containing protein [Gammaproteobacteria bacterium]